MKKILSFFFALAIILSCVVSFSSCSSKNALDKLIFLQENALSSSEYNAKIEQFTTYDERYQWETKHNKEIKKAIANAQATFVETLENKEQTMLSAKGNNLSGGQKQRLILARALAGKPKVLILDDASSALDYKTDQALRNSIQANYKDTTQIIISSRISSIMNADKIIVLEEGHITGYGSHEQLLNTNKMYQDIYNTQLGGSNYE